MSTTIAITCPSCSKQLKGPAELQGKKIKCKACGEPFVVGSPKKANPASKSAPPAKPQAAANAKKGPEAPKPKASDHEDGEGDNPYKLSEIIESVFRCPQCAMEMESDDAIICLNCGYNIQTRTMLKTEKAYAHTTWDWTKWWAPALLCALLVVACLGVVGFCAFTFVTNKQYEEWYLHLAARIWAAVICGFGAWYGGRFAFKRLVLHPTPPIKVKY